MLEVKNGDDVLLYLDRKRRYLIKAKENELFHTHKGIVQFNDLIGKPFGVKIRSSQGIEFTVFKPTLKDYIVKIARQTQIMYPKDMGLILIYGNICPGSVVVEGGTGSGALASLIATHIKPTGKVYSYEIRDEFIKIAQKNFQRLGVSEFISIKKADLTQRIEESDVDAVVLDIASPWLVVPHAYTALKNTGMLASFSPTIEQVLKTVESMRAVGFMDIETLECIVRRYQVEPGRTRPETLTIGHTGYLTFGRKTVRS